MKSKRMPTAPLLLGVFGPLIAPYPVGTRAMDLDHMYAPMSWSHWLGTDKSGVDTLSQLLHGAREALLLSTIVVGISATIGVTIGMVAGYARGFVDEAIMRVVDIFLAFPGLLLNIAIVAVVARPGLPLFIAALCANGWVGYARVARGQVLSLRERDYVMAARALGASTPRILFRHIAPNLIAPILVQVSLSFGNVIAAEASLSFLGLGPQVDHTACATASLLPNSRRRWPKWVRASSRRAPRNRQPQANSQRPKPRCRAGRRTGRASTSRCARPRRPQAQSVPVSK